MRKLIIAALAALTLGALGVSSASALTAYDQSNGATLSVGQGITATQVGTSTVVGTFFGISITAHCTGATAKGSVVTATGTVINGSITSATWTGCSSTLKASCTIKAVGLPWTPSGNQGGVAATSTTSVGVAPGTNGAIDVSDCVGGRCTVTGGTASYGGLVNVMTGTWTNTVPQINQSSSSIKPVSCLMSGATISGKSEMTVDATGGAMGLK